MDDVRMYAEYYGFDNQGEDESDLDFRRRVAGSLRDAGHIVEAHEVFNGKRWDADDGGDVLTGVTGAIAQALQGVDYGSKGERQIDDDFAAGVVANNPQPKMTPEMVMLLMEMFGNSGR